ncbi:uncharacterized protein APUU_70859S [Aspergillus puulaauensis]|uniref:Uncharacterized protein n=1 Tax=Aspergillus puulaauensis TaxID=1220207 RepID=A0A7R8ARF9_9EURO|nr:uncharacterized protein APUU_70859S [Aspergillus puulaauensis]BCS29289.1 hypothetical protein APUU_70859S [Aspergillus puulaauensis]
MAPVLFRRVCSLVLAISSLTGTLAQVCTSSNLRYHISSQDQLDVLAQNCTVLDSPFYIESNYTGSSFVLHNVTNISQDVIFEWSEDWPRSQGPISVEFPDLIHAKRIGLWEAVSLTKLSLPKLEYVETFETFGVWGMPDLEFPSLRNTSQIDLLGNISRVSFPALKTVHGALSLDNISDPSMRTMNTNPLTIDLSLPVLEKAYEIKVTGTVAR